MSDLEDAQRRSVIGEWASVVALGAVALLACAKLGEDVFHHETSTFDGAVRQWVLAHQSPAAHTFFLWITTVGSVTPMIIVAVIGAAWLWFRGRRHVAATVLVAPAAAVTTYHFVKMLFGRLRPAGASLLSEHDASFPSAHATTSAAICFTLAYVFWRERQVPGVVALAFAVLVPFLIGSSRVYLDVHWTTDVLGGWSAGLFIAVLSAILYNRISQARIRTHSPSSTA
jgi:undecaprenyl-diphosphatase